MVQQRLRAVFANVFQVDPAQLSPTVSPAEIDAWIRDTASRRAAGVAP